MKPQKYLPYPRRSNNNPRLNLNSTLHHSTPFFLVFLSLIIFLSLTGCDQSSSSPKTVIAISQIVEHPALNEARQGLEDVLKEELGADKFAIIYQNAQGNISAAKQIAENFKSRNPAVLVGISSLSAQTLKISFKNEKIPLVFSCVTDPVAAGLAKDLKNPPEGITGVIDTPPLDKQIKMMRKIMPNLKKLGVLYNPGESNSVATINTLKKLCKAAKIEVLEGPVSKSAELSLTARHLMPKVEAIYIPQDNVIVASMAGLAKISYELKTPLFVSDTGSIRNGALATISYSYYEVGRETGKKILAILKGKKPETLPIASPSKTAFYKNEEAAEKLGVRIPKDIAEST